MSFASPTDRQRTALLQFESAFALWCAAREALSLAECRLWSAALQDPGGAAQRTCSAEVLRLRVEARAAYEALLRLLRESP